MKNFKAISIIILLAAMAGCEGNKQSTDELIIVDVTKRYPEKELILQDFMDVEYIALETTDEFLTQGRVKDIGKEVILVTNRFNDGDIFVFDRNGKGIRKINRKGQSGEEYLMATEIVLDEDNTEMFVVNSSARNILVYDLYGNFKRSFKNADNCYYSYVFNYDRDNLICYKSYPYTENEKRPSHQIISKKDGSITREISLPFQEINTHAVIGRGMENGDDLIVTTTFHQISPYHGKWALVEASSDTVYSYLPNGTIRPLIVRTPSIHSMDTEVLLYPGILTNRYFFMRTLRKEVDFETVRMIGPNFDLVYDKQENAIYQYTVYNDDFSNKRQAYLSSEPVNQEIATCQSLEAYQLVEAYEKGQLKGILKEIAAELDVEDNPVIMLVKHRKQ